MAFGGEVIHSFWTLHLSFLSSFSEAREGVIKFSDVQVMAKYFLSSPLVPSPESEPWYGVACKLVGDPQRNM